ncbi:phage-related tail protein [Saccharomonospora amisosensis]|uniref:Phage-related tail protein n=1 Tax=Saccharomonospora amisosensis TaxID=1128677 RepID=A0A7X5UM97_9PSEU|nr:hypothetical protein [Saccharomonospora amisosensis]NIJ10621.1 phage-related tail protein [Saccharomonospora amisosensis]
MALLAVQDATEGAAVTLTAASAGGDQIPQGVRAGGWQLGHLLLVINGGAAAITVTVAGMAPVSVPAGGTAVIPAYGIYRGSPRDITYSAVTSVTVAAVRVSG